MRIGSFDFLVLIWVNAMRVPSYCDHFIAQTSDTRWPVQSNR
jgi:hypothetical protein